MYLLWNRYNCNYVTISLSFYTVSWRKYINENSDKCGYNDVYKEINFSISVLQSFWSHVDNHRKIIFISAGTCYVLRYTCMMFLFVSINQHIYTGKIKIKLMKMKILPKRTGRLCFWSLREKRIWTKKSYNKHIDIILYVKEIEIIECASIYVKITSCHRKCF